MSIKPQMEHGVVCRLPGERFGYFGWPSIAKLDDGTLVVGASGPRWGHVCPWGKTSLSMSGDEGETWSEPTIIHDSALDDRDVGVVALGGETLMATWFTLDSRTFLESYRNGMSGSTAAWMEGKVSAITDETVKAHKGSWTRVSFDGGRSFTAPRRAPVTAPHGPILLKNKTLMYAGKRFPDADDRPVECDVAVVLSIDLGRTWKEISAVPLPEGFTWDEIHEAHVCQMPDGTILCALRVHEEKVQGTWMTRSTDGGYHWEKPYRLPCDGTPPHLLMHSSGVAVCVYGYRFKPYGQRALLTRDGLNWSEEIILRDDGSDGDLGYPASVELPDGSIMTIYYQRLEGDRQTSVLSTRWTLPDIL